MPTALKFREETETVTPTATCEGLVSTASATYTASTVAATSTATARLGAPVRRRSRLRRVLGVVWIAVSVLSLAFCVGHYGLALIHAHILTLEAEVSLGFNAILQPLFWIWIANRMKKQNAANAANAANVVRAGIPVTKKTGKP